MKLLAILLFFSTTLLGQDSSEINTRAVESFDYPITDEYTVLQADATDKITTFVIKKAPNHFISVVVSPRDSIVEAIIVEKINGVSKVVDYCKRVMKPSQLSVKMDNGSIFIIHSGYIISLWHNGNDYVLPDYQWRD